MNEGAENLVDAPPVFHPTPAPSQDDVQSVVKRAANRIVRFLQKRALIALATAPGDGEVTVVVGDETLGDSDQRRPLLWQRCCAASARWRALLITGETLNISSFMAIIMVMGVVHKNGILMLDSEQHYSKQGMPPDEAVFEAGRRRFRPIVKTALATMGGMLRLALNVGSGVVALGVEDEI